jgi:D-alanyl-D-alanine carboxypeptidase (penicillin-binding protein 5/6)
LDRRGQTSSAYDLALIGRAAMRLPDFRGYVSTRTASIPGGRSSAGKMLPGFKINNHNRLLYNYRGAIGIKNGYTIAAKQTFIAAATRSGKTYIVTEMASDNGSWRPTAALLDWAFAHGTGVTPIGRLVEPGSTTRPGLDPRSAAGVAHENPPAVSGAGALAKATAARLPALKPWLGAAGLLGGVALVGAFAARSISSRRG